MPWERGKKANCFITETFTSYFTLTGASDAAARLWEKLPSTPASELKRISQPWKVECRVRNPDLWTLTFTERQMYQQKKSGHKTVSKSMKHLSVFESTIVLLCQRWLLRKLVCSKGLSWLFSNSWLWSCCSVFGWKADHYGLFNRILDCRWVKISVPLPYLANAQTKQASTNSQYGKETNASAAVDSLCIKCPPTCCVPTLNLWANTEFFLFLWQLMEVKGFEWSHKSFNRQV